MFGYSNSDWSGDRDDRKSTAAYVFMYGNAAVSWSSMNEAIVTSSSCEAEYILQLLKMSVNLNGLACFFLEMNLKEEEKMELLLI